MQQNAQNVIDAPASGVHSRYGHILAAAVLGFVVLLFFGFVPLEAVHNAAHDTRHALSFPCH